MPIDPRDLGQVVEAARAVPVASQLGGWHDEIEAALIDAVLSIRARYGSEKTGVRGAIHRYRAAQDGRALDDLDVLAGYGGEGLAQLLDNWQSTGGVPKARVIVNAAKNFLHVGVRNASDLNPFLPAHRFAYTSVKGLSDVTWEYFGMLLGKPGVKADTRICRFVSDAVGRSVQSTEARALVLSAAKELARDPIELDHSDLDVHEPARWFLGPNPHALRCCRGREFAPLSIVCCADVDGASGWAAVIG